MANQYDQVIEQVFFKNYNEGDLVVYFEREDIVDACNYLNIARIKNIGDVPYTYRFRKELPESIKNKLPDVSSDWIIVGAGIGKYYFKQAAPAKIEPTLNRQRVKIPDATPEIVKKYAPGTDEQALLTKVRYNRLIDLFTGLTCYSIQNHLRTTVKNVGQIEIDEVYVGVNKRGTHFIIPCQAKSPGDRFGIVQVKQDIDFCKQYYPNAICKPIALQFLSENDVALLELSIDEESDVIRLNVVDEKHYRLVGRDGISDAEVLSLTESEISF